jgi:hypothetical protein
MSDRPGNDDSLGDEVKGSAKKIAGQLTGS